MAVANALAYYFTTVKCFIIQAQKSSKALIVKLSNLRPSLAVANALAYYVTAVKCFTVQAQKSFCSKACTVKRFTAVIY